MKRILNKNKELVWLTVITFMFMVYYFDLWSDGMMFSGIVSAATVIYVGLLWSENVTDERDEYIRAKTDRSLYIVTICILLIDIIYKTVNHVSYVESMILLTLLAISKLALSKFYKSKN